MKTKFMKTLSRWWSQFKKSMKDLIDCTDWDESQGWRH